TAGQIVTCSDSRKYCIKYRQCGTFCRYEHAHLGHDADDGNLSHISTFTCHVRTGNQIHEVFPIHLQVVWYISIFSDDLFNDVMSALLNLELILVEIRFSETVCV